MGYYNKRREEVDYLYLYDFNNEYIKVGRSFNVKNRLVALKYSSGLKDIKLLRLLTGKHEDVFRVEQSILSSLRSKGYSYTSDWTHETFSMSSLQEAKTLFTDCDLKSLH